MAKKTVTVPNQESLDELTQQVRDNPSLRKEDYVAASKTSSADSDDDVTQQAAPTPSAAALQRSFVAASSQFNALARFGSAAADAFSLEDQARAWELKQKEFKNAFLHDKALEIDSHGDLRDYLKYLRAVEAIRVKAAALGYGAESQAVPINSVPGGYVGRFGGNDIYAAV